MKFKEIAKHLDQIATLLELKGENSFKIKAHHNAARILENNLGNGTFLEDILGGKIKGIGTGIQQLISELQKTGESSLLNELKANFSESFLELLKIKGLGAKKLKILAEELAINSIEELEDACKKNKLLQIKGFAEKTQKTILENIAFYKPTREFFLFKTAKEWAELIKDHLAEDENTLKFAEVGTLRRKDEILNKIEFIISVKNIDALVNKLKQLKEIIEITKNADELSLLFGNKMKGIIYVVDEKDFSRNLISKTGSEKHLALLGLNEIKNQNISDEQAFYHALSLSFIPPEYRLGETEVEEAKELFRMKRDFPETIKAQDITGVLHAHSSYSDGLNSLSEMAKACKNKGYQYLGITDHSQSAFYAGGLKVDQIKRQHEEIDSLNEELAPFVIFKGIESDILKDGSLDYPDKILESFDFIISSVHSHFELSEKEMNERVIRAIKNPYTKILGHPTGRLLLRRKGYAIDLEQILETAAKHAVVVEINANPLRLDLDWRYHRKAIELGVRLAICPDAHSVEQIDYIKYGVYAARKGRVLKENCLTSLSLEEIKSFFQTKL